MGKEVNLLTKEPNAVTYELYDKLMLSDIGRANGMKVYPADSLDLTVATVPRPTTHHHDLLFYRFAHMEAPVARITHKGESMQLMTYEIGRIGSRFNISEQDIQERLKQLLASL